MKTASVANGYNSKGWASMEGTFADDRQILDSVLIAHECIDSSNRQRRLGIICKLDFEKAYDIVDWGFLQYTLERMGFGKKWRDWIHA